MGRELRKVPPRWEHPKNDEGHYIPIFDQFYHEAAKEWLEQCILWSKGEHEMQGEEYKYFWEYEEPPKKENYLPYCEAEATWFQVYENVSEGTPVTPAFKTEKELVDYLVNHGDFTSHIYSESKVTYSREAAENFVYKTKYAPSMSFCNGVIKCNIHTCEE